LQPDKNRIVTTKVEHEVVSKTCEHLEKRGYEIVRLGVDEQGLLDLETVRNSIDEETALVSIMAANNETGILFPVAEIAEIVKEHSNALFHVDGVQTVGKIPVSLKDTQIDLFAVSGHKFHAPKGVGALYVRDGLHIPPLMLGGKRRAGTEAVASVIALGTACELVKNLDFNQKISALRDRLENEILQKIPNARLNGTSDPDLRLPNTTNISFIGVEGESILAHLDAHEIYVSTGSACNSDMHTSSPVLQAMNIPYKTAMGAVRFSLSRYTTAEEINFTLETLPEIIERLRDMSPLG
jgi:cysteine desulfurase